MVRSAEVAAVEDGAFFDPRVSQNVDRQPLDVRENGQGIRILKACVAAKGGFFEQ